MKILLRSMRYITCLFLFFLAQSAWSNTLCINGSKTYTSNATPPSFSNLTVGWRVTYCGNVSSYGQTNSFTYTFSQAGTYFIEHYFSGTDTNGLPVNGVMDSFQEIVADCNAATTPALPCLTCAPSPVNPRCLNDQDVIQGQTQYTQAQVANWAWKVTGATIVSQSFTSATVSWSTPGNACIEFQYYVKVGSVWQFNTINFSASVSSNTRAALPNPTPTVQYLIESATISYTGAAPSGTTWYWQTSPTGMSAATSANPYAVTQPGNYYLRALNACSWSTQSLLVPVNSAQWLLYKPNITQTTVKVPGITNASNVVSSNPDQTTTSITYFDGLGRTEQVSQISASPLRNDVVIPYEYDLVGRTAKNYLPYKSSSTDGYYQSNALGKGNYSQGDQFIFYQNGSADKVQDDSKPYSQTVFEPSPLNRPAKQGAAGVNWQPDANINSITDHTVKHHYETNGANEVILFTYDFTSGFVSTGSNSQPQYYDANLLQVKRTTDEHQNNVLEYIDKLGHTICKKVQYKMDDQGNKLYACTYYIYDDFGNLVVVLPPRAIQSALSALTQN